MRISAALKLIALIPSCSIHKMLASFSGVEFKDCIEIKEKKVAVLCSLPPQNVKWGTFTS